MDGSSRPSTAQDGVQHATHSLTMSVAGPASKAAMRSALKRLLSCCRSEVQNASHLPLTQKTREGKGFFSLAELLKSLGKKGKRL